MTHHPPSNDQPETVSSAIVTKQASGALPIVDIEPVRAPVEPVDPALPSDWRELLFPFLLLCIALLVVGISWHKSRIENPSPTIPSTQPLEQLTPIARITEAQTIITSADTLWTQGYRGINDQVMLQESRKKYQQSWELVTGQNWPAGSQTLVLDSPEARSVRDYLEIRLSELDRTLDRPWYKLW